MAMTLAEKILARASGEDSVRPGQIVTCKVDLAMCHDSSGPRRYGPRLKELGVGVWDPSKVVVITDHFVPAVDTESARILKLTRDWVADNGIEHFYDMQGICHIKLAEGGHLKPGMFVCGGDSHSTNGGAFGCYMAGYGATEMTGVMATGEIWVKVPETMRFVFEGELPPYLMAKDLILAVIGDIGVIWPILASELAEQLGSKLEFVSYPQQTDAGQRMRNSIAENVRHLSRERMLQVE